jgi:hypothetical protein
MFEAVVHIAQDVLVPQVDDQLAWINLGVHLDQGGVNILRKNKNLLKRAKLSGVNFTNILHKACTCADPKSAKRY